MATFLPSSIHLSPTVEKALERQKPLVALESTVITHGLPYPQNLQLARDMELEVIQNDAVPATIAVLDGLIYVGMEAAQLERLSTEQPVYKISVRDYAPAITLRRSGGATVAGTLFAAQSAGLHVFATGGIGGVHRDAPFDVSADLQQMQRSPLVVVCAGAKAILDLPATIELLETLGIPVVGYQTDEFPAFYSRQSGLPVGVRLDTPQEIAQLARSHWELGMPGAVLVVQPPPAESALEPEFVEQAIQQALAEARSKGIRGQAVTPFLLQRVSELTEGSSLQANLALLHNNARLAAQIAQYI